MDRREFLKSSALATGGLVIAFGVPGARRFAFAQTTATFVPNAFLRVGSDDSITVLIPHSEMGQGISTSIPMAVAEELECDWKSIRFEHAPADLAYAHTAFGIQVTGGSTSTWESFDQMRTEFQQRTP